MGRRRIYQHYEVPGTVALMVNAMIQDYPRRKRLIEYSSAPSEDVRNICLQMNSVIDASINDCEPLLSAIIISDIISCRGYDRSEATGIASKNLYYRVKQKIIEEIAEKLHLV